MHAMAHVWRLETTYWSNSLLPICEVSDLSSVCHAGQQAPLPAASFCQSLYFFKMLIFLYLFMTYFFFIISFKVYCYQYPFDGLIYPNLF